MSSNLKQPSCPNGEESSSATYSSTEILRNRRWNIASTALAISALWAWHLLGTLPQGSATLGTGVVLFLAVLYRLLFASKSSAKIHEDSAGLGKTVHARTLGTILGYLHDGFKR